MNFFRVILLSPFSWLFLIITFLRNKLYELGWKKSCTSSVKIICVGNLSMGGTGKSPMTEYLIRFLAAENKTAVLSRGYKRKTKGFAEVNTSSTSSEVGDEPRQFKLKFPENIIAVCEDRCTGIDTIKKNYNGTKIIILDDAFQHRKVKAGLNILLTEYSKLFTRDYLFPLGTLRESRSGARRADVVVVSKCPESLSLEEKNKTVEEISCYSQCSIVFGKIKYCSIRSIHDDSVLIDIKEIQNVLLFTGIANPMPLKSYLLKIFKELFLVRFQDHHEYSATDLTHIQETFNNIAVEKKIIITTEKDAMRLDKQALQKIIEKLPIYYIPVEFDFFPEDKKAFNQILKNYAEHD